MLMLTEHLYCDRYYHPAPPAKVSVKAERTFEGISLDVPGQSAKTTTAMSRFQLCPACYQNWCARAPNATRVG